MENLFILISPRVCFDDRSEHDDGLFKLNMLIQFPPTMRFDTSGHSSEKNLGESLKYWENIFSFYFYHLHSSVSHSIMEKCLLFTLRGWIQLKDEIFDDLLDQTNCAITPSDLLFRFVLCTQTSFFLFFIRRYRLTSCAMKREEITRRKILNYFFWSGKSG